MNKISSHRWRGRFFGYMEVMMRQKRLRFDTSDSVTYNEVLLKLLEVVNEEEKQLLFSFLDKIKNASEEEKTNNHTWSEQDANTEIEKGKAEVGYIGNADWSLLLREEDYYTAIEQAQIEARKKTRKRWTVFLAVAVCVIIGVVLYNLPYFEEMRFYNKVVEEQSQYYCKEYYSKYPDGRHYEDVKYLETQVTNNNIVVITDYLREFPNGKYYAELESVYDKLWQEELDRYESRDKSKDSPEAVAYMRAMLDYMKTNRVNKVRININSKVTLKDCEEFGETAMDMLKQMCAGETLSVESDVLSLKKNFSREDEKSLRDILSEGVNSSFSRMFSPGFVSVVDDRELEETIAAPELTFDYVVKNALAYEGDDLQIPSLWVYTSNGTPTSYILAVDVKFTVKFTIPNSDITYTYTEVGDPGKEIRNIGDVRDGYRRMTAVCFAKFSNKMSTNLGLEETYFQNDDTE